MRRQFIMPTGETKFVDARERYIPPPHAIEVLKYGLASIDLIDNGTWGEPDPSSPAGRLPIDEIVQKIMETLERTAAWQWFLTHMTGEQSATKQSNPAGPPNAEADQARRVKPATTPARPAAAKLAKPSPAPQALPTRQQPPIPYQRSHRRYPPNARERERFARDALNEVIRCQKRGEEITYEEALARQYGSYVEAEEALNMTVRDRVPDPSPARQMAAQHRREQYSRGEVDRPWWESGKRHTREECDAVAKTAAKLGISFEKALAAYDGGGGNAKS